MQISFITPHLEIRGANRRIIELSNHLMKKGHKVTIFHSDGTPCKWMRCNADIKSLDEVINQSHQVLILTNRKNYLIFKKARAKLKIFYILLLFQREKKYIKGFHPTIFLSYFEHARLFRAVLNNKKVLKVSNSTGLQIELEEEGIKSELLIGGVNQEIFHSIKKTRNFNWEILCVGDPLDWKGTKYIKEAIKIVKKDEPRIKLNTYYNKGVPQNKMSEVYNSADIFIDAQLGGGWNNPVSEAMSCKIPVICSDNSGIKDLAFNNRTAIVVPLKNSEKIAEAILRLGKDVRLREKIVENAYKNIIQYTWEKSTKNLEKIINNYS